MYRLLIFQTIAILALGFALVLSVQKGVFCEMQCQELRETISELRKTDHNNRP